jgi:5-methylcytosine-specific restriction endonuclease McrA
MKVKYSNLSVLKEIELNIKKDHTVKIVIAESRKNHLTTEQAKIACNKLQIPFKNQSIGTLLLETQKQFFAPKREPITQEMRNEIIENQAGKCNICDKKMKLAEIDHILPVSGGGSSKKENLQALCPECHKDKSNDEYSKYLPTYEFTSCLNIQAYDILKSNFSRKFAFNHYLKKKRKLFLIIILTQRLKALI